MYIRELQLPRLKRRVGVSSNNTDKDQLLLDYLEDAEIAVKSYCKRDDIEDGMVPSIRSLAVVFYNREGNEGESSRSEGGVSQSFEEGIPSIIRSSLQNYRRATIRSFRR